MTSLEFKVWRSVIMNGLHAAGFRVVHWYGFPMVPRPPKQRRRCQLLDFEIVSPSCDRVIFSLGLIFVPEGFLSPEVPRNPERLYEESEVPEGFLEPYIPWYDIDRFEQRREYRLEQRSEA